MRRSSIVLFICLIFSLGKSLAQANYKGMWLLHGYVGTDLYKELYIGQYGDVKSEGLYYKINHLSTTGLWGARAEYMLNSNFGVGLDFWYGHTSVIATCTEKTETYPNYKSTYDSAIISKDLKRLNSTLRFDIHFGNSPIIDPYVNVALGAAIYKYIVTTTNRDIIDEPALYIPISFKVGGGIKVWIIPQVTVYLEANLGGPLLSAGLCYRFFPKVKLASITN